MGQAGGTSEQIEVGVATDSSGAVFITGYTEGSLHDNINLGFYDIFLSKYDSNGTRQWTQQFGTSKNDYGSRWL